MVNESEQTNILFDFEKFCLQKLLLHPISSFLLCTTQYAIKKLQFAKHKYFISHPSINWMGAFASKKPSTLNFACSHKRNIVLPIYFEVSNFSTLHQKLSLETNYDTKHSTLLKWFKVFKLKTVTRKGNNYKKLPKMVTFCFLLQSWH